MEYLFPRLDDGEAELWASKFSEMSPRQIADELPGPDVAGKRFAPTGGQRVDNDDLRELRNQIMGLAEQGGYPDETSLTARRRFDLELARILLDLPIIHGEALRNEVWQYLTCVLVPDLVAWRFGDRSGGRVSGPTSEERFLGGVRNLLQRLWWRAITLQDPSADDELWLLDTEKGGLTEDNLVALVERSHTNSYVDLCRSIAHQFVFYRKFVDDLENGTHEKLMREVMKRVVRVAAFANLEAVSSDKTQELVGNMFVETIEEFGGEAPPPGRRYRSVAARYLKPIDLPEGNSNQHEIQGIVELQELLGKEEKVLDCNWRAYWEDGSVREEVSSRVKWYDARKSTPRRGEWRLYYEDNGAMSVADEGDLLVLATSYRDEELHGFVLPRGESLYLQVRGILESEEGVRLSKSSERYLRERLHSRV